MPMARCHDMSLPKLSTMGAEWRMGDPCFYSLQCFFSSQVQSWKTNALFFHVRFPSLAPCLPKRPIRSSVHFSKVTLMVLLWYRAGSTVSSAQLALPPHLPCMGMGMCIANLHLLSHVVLLLASLLHLCKALGYDHECSVNPRAHHKKRNWQLGGLLKFGPYKYLN